MLSREQLQYVLDEQRRTGELFVETLLRLEYLDESTIVQGIIKHHNIPYISIERYYIAQEVATTFPERLLRQYLFMPLDRLGGVMTIVAGSPLDANAQLELERLAGCKVQAFAGLPSEVKQAINTHYAEAASDELSSLGNLLLGEEG